MAIGVPDFGRQRGRSPIDLALRLDQRQRAQQDQGMFGNMGLREMMMLGQMGGGEPTGVDQFLAGTEPGGVSMPASTQRRGLPNDEMIDSPIVNTIGVS